VGAIINGNNTTQLGECYNRPCYKQVENKLMEWQTHQDQFDYNGKARNELLE
jgi:hypothetical protein